MKTGQFYSVAGNEPALSALKHMRIAVSYYCSLKCKHCYVPELNRTKYRTLLEDSQLSIGEIEAFIDTCIGELGLEKVSITGGEALLSIVWPRTREVLQYALSRGLQVQLNTSGSGNVLMGEVAQACGDGIDNLTIQLSLDGIATEQVDEFRGQKGSMERALRSLNDAGELGMNLQIRYTMTEANWQEAVECYNLVTEKNALSFHIKPMFPAGTARENTGILISTDNLVRKVQLDLLSKSVDNPTVLGLPEPVYVSESEFPDGANAHVIKCECGGGAGYLSTNGDVYPCTYMVGAPDDKRWVLGNIKDESFDFVSLWKQPTTYDEFRSDNKDGSCTAQNLLVSSI